VACEDDLQAEMSKLMPGNAIELVLTLDPVAALRTDAVDLHVVPRGAPKYGLEPILVKNQDPTWASSGDHIHKDAAHDAWRLGCRVAGWRS
jgi:hypothetical protein